MMINKAIYNILSNDATVTGLVSTRIFAVAAPESTVAPLIVYNRDSVEPHYTKLRHEYDISSVTFLIFSKDYSDGIDILEAVRNALELNRGTFNGVKVTDARVTGIDEGYDLEADTYYQAISMEFIND